MAISHKLAASRSIEDDLVGRVLDQVVSHARAGRMEWEVINELADLRQQFHELAACEKVPSRAKSNAIEGEFWRKHGIDPSKLYERPHITIEDIERALANT